MVLLSICVCIATLHHQQLVQQLLQLHHRKLSSVAVAVTPSSILSSAAVDVIPKLVIAVKHLLSQIGYLTLDNEHLFCFSVMKQINVP